MLNTLIFLSNVKKAINLAWKGYLALFIAMTFIWLTITVLNYISKKKK